MIYPTFEEVKKASCGANVIPICKTILADTETPVSTWLKLFSSDKYSFLLESVSGGDTVARYSFLGGNPFATFSASGENWVYESSTKRETGNGDPVTALRKHFAEYKVTASGAIPRFSGGAVGYFAYDSIRFKENIPDKNDKKDPLYDIFFGFYRDIVAFDNRENRLLLISNIVLENNCSDIKREYENAILSIEKMEQRLINGTVDSSIIIGKSGDIKSNVLKEEYEDAVEKCREYIRAGDIFQVVLSQRFSVEVEAKPFDLYRILRVVNPSPYMYYLNLDDTSVIGASPEMLVRVEDGKVETRPIAGTRRRGESEARDEELIKDLKSDPKEIAEHVMLVDLGRNDVGRVSNYGTLKIDDMMHIEKYSHVIHLVTNVSGELKNGCDAFDALFSCFPAGTLSGAPKIRAMEIIDELENVKRGLYGGALGYIDFNGNMDTCIVIRTILYHNGKAYIQAGAGIVADSVPQKEYQETVDKASALFSSIKRAAEIAGSDSTKCDTKKAEQKC
ncbi:anthranilate synthase component I [Chitinispirillales bacterium ANBcel5]|uniref:anthranilate synthase component I n=1 Tax=Cellulosispirillum alkaliphilum TaxID=3039283 RepID=UPI002A56B9F6|nr:anthranilate synthase component I [Chitinispirillales bacterium ANBcel5]